MQLLWMPSCTCLYPHSEAPEMRGSEFLSIVGRDYVKTVRIILTGQTSLGPLREQRAGAAGVGRKAELTSTFERGLSSLWMVFQPIISVSKDRTLGFEALVRTGEPAVSQPPNLFDIAEELERLWELERLIRRTVADAAEWGAYESEPEHLLLALSRTSSCFWVSFTPALASFAIATLPPAAIFSLTTPPCVEAFSDTLLATRLPT